ncbi:uncharacterized protein [Phyllobates terribilis]|uniref:uncharacterized protein isoform X1 n=1 Tax=Phyllobates terribilis TaxID=111132 RepID=UPI003CCB1B5E
MVTLLGQYQSVQETGSAKDPAETLLSLEETNQGLNSKVSQENNSGCTGCMKFGNHTLYTREKLNEDITLCGDCDTEDHGPDHKPSMNNRQNNMDLYTSPQSNSSEIFEDNRKETDVKSEKSKLFDATCPNDHSSLSLPQDSNVSNGIRSDDHSDEFCMLKMSKSEDGTRAQLVEDNLALRVDGTTELFESEQIGKEPCKPNHEVNNIFSTIDDCDRNLSNLNPDDDIDIDACPTTAPNNQQDGANMWEDGTIVLEDERSPDHGEDINELLNPTSSFKEADVQEKRNKAFDDTSLNDSSSTCLHHQESNVPQKFSPDNNSAMILKSEDSSTVGNEKKNVVSESQRMNISLHSEDMDDVGHEPNQDTRYSHEVNKSISATNHTGINDSTIKNDDSTNIKASNISVCSKLQGGGDVDTKEPENKMSLDHERSNNEPSCLEPNNAKDDKTFTYAENKISPEAHRSNNKTTELFGSGHHGYMGCRSNDEINTFSTISPTGEASNFKIGSKIDASTITTSSELRTGAIEEGRNKDFTQRDTSTAYLESDKNAVIDPENKTSTDHGGSNKFSLVEPKIRENDVHKGKRKMFDVPSPNVSSSTQEVSRPVDTKSCISISSNPEGSTTLFHWQLKSQKQKNIVKRHLDQNRTKQNKKVNCKTNDDKQAHNRVIGASKTDGKASIDDGCKKTTNISKTNNGTSPAAYTGRKRDNHNFKSNDVPKNHNPKDKTSSGDGGENNVLSRLKLKSKHRSQPIEKSPTVLDTTGSKCFQQHGDVSTTGRRLNAKSRTMNRSLWSAFSFGHSWVYYFLVIMALMTPSLVQASPVKPPVKPLRQMLLCSNKSLMNQSLTIKSFDHRHSPGCTFRYTTLPFSHDCSKFGYTVSALNETCVEMQIADDRSTEDWRMEYGNKANGDGLQATRGELLNNQSDIKERSEYNNSHDSSANKNQTEEQSQTEDESKKEDNRENKNENDTKLITVLVLAVLAALLVISIPLLWKFCPKFRSCVKSCKSPCTRSDTNSDPETGSNLNSNTDPNAKLSTPVPLENGNINGDDHNDVDDDESQRLNPESSEEPTPKACETSL